MSGRLPNIGQDPFSQKSPFLNDLERQPKESSVIKLRKTVLSPTPGIPKPSECARC